MTIKSEYGFICQKEAYGCDRCILHKFIKEKGYYEYNRLKDIGKFERFYKPNEKPIYNCNTLLKQYFGYEIILYSQYKDCYLPNDTNMCQSETTICCQNIDGLYRNCCGCSAYEYAMLLGYKPYKTSTGYKLFSNGSEIKSCANILAEGCGISVSPSVTDDDDSEFIKMNDQIMKVTDMVKSDYEKTRNENIAKRLAEEEAERIRRITAEENRKREVEQYWFNEREHYIYDPVTCELYHSILDAPVCCRKCSTCDIANIYRSHGYKYTCRIFREACQNLACCFTKEIISVFGMYQLKDIIDFSSPDHGGINYGDSDKNIIKLLKRSFAAKKE